MPTSTLTDLVSAHAMLLKVALGCLVGPLLVLLSLALWYMTRTSISRRRTASDIEVCYGLFLAFTDGIEKCRSMSKNLLLAHPTSSRPPSTP